jgi:exonuclease SbcD
MKILHTADWHLGKQLKKVDFQEDMEKFFHWLTELMKEEQVDVLLMSGDLFDLSNPSQATMLQYYQFLKRLLQLPNPCKIIITGGNHDGAAVLDAPRDLLQMLDVTVVGAVPEQVGDLFVPIERSGEKLVVAAVPFLRDRDIRRAAPGESYEDKINLVRDGMRQYYADVNAHYKAHFEGWPFIVMGHLFVSGASVSDSERDIQVGNQAGIESGLFGALPHYVALGHIHKPQTAGAPHIRYSGSPIPLSFSEKSDQKQVVLLEWDGAQFKQDIREVPVFRRLKTLTGTLDEVREQVFSLEPGGPLPDLLELQIKEDKESVVLSRQLVAFAEETTLPHAKIVQYQIIASNKTRSMGSILPISDSVGRYTPLEIFLKRLEEESHLEQPEALIAAFTELVESLEA